MRPTPIAKRLEDRSMWLAESGCWIWLGTTDGDGYGRVKLNGRMTRAARTSWMTFKGEIPAGLHVLHVCDVPACINPNHLFLGTHADNMADRNRKGRYSRQHLNLRSMAKEAA